MNPIDSETETIETLFGRKGKIPHYYGDSVRMMFISSAVIYAVAMPLFGNLIPVSTGTGILIVIVLAFLAGVTNPNFPWLMLINAAVAGAGIYLAEMAAISFFNTDSFVLFIMRQVVALLLLFAFYYSVKSFRSMLSGDIGAQHKAGELKKGPDA